MRGWLLITLAFLSIANFCPGKDYGAQHMVAELKKVLVKRPDPSYAVEDPEKWHYTGSPNLEIAQEEHDAFVEILKLEGVEVYYHQAFYPNLADSIFVYDPAIITDAGAIILKMGKTLRRGEEGALERRLNDLGIPTYYRLHGSGTAEGGDTFWIDEKTLAVGLSYRTNAEGLRQIREALEPLGIEVIAVELPHGDGPDCCLHLMSLISPVGDHRAVVYKKYLSVSFIKELERRGFDLIDVPDEEFLTMGSNVLAIRPGVVLTIEGNPITKQRMEEKGIKVYTYKGDELSHPSEGGATCLTKPLLRE